jgi:predicted Zn-dependent protease with MMP-like domain
MSARSRARAPHRTRGRTARPRRAAGARGAATVPIVHVSRRRFEQLVAEALDALPPELLADADNVAVIVEDWPRPEQLAGHGDDGHAGHDHAGHDHDGVGLFGLYEGVALVDRSLGGVDLPDRITLFRMPLVAACADEDELFEEIRVTLVHEFAHHFGIDDERLDELGWA